MKVLGIAAALLLSLMLANSGSIAQEDYTKPDQNQDKKPQTESWGEPVFEKSVEGTGIRVWIMKGAEKPLGLNQPAAEAVGGGQKTHRVKVEATDEAAKGLLQAKVELKVTSPSGESTTESLNSVGTVHEGTLSMEESGTYKINVTVTTSDGKKRNADFTYKV